MKTINKFKTTTINYKYLKLFFLCVILITVSCKGDDESCGYKETNPPGCNLKSTLNLSTGIDTNGNVIIPAFGAKDPNWKVLNLPPLVDGNNASLPCANNSVSTFTGEAFVMNYSNSAINSWVNQSGASTIAPFDLGNIGSFGCDNAKNKNNKVVPYVFERSFCVLQDTSVDLNFSFKGDDQVKFELVKNNPFSIINTSSTYVWSSTIGVPSWTSSSLNLSSGSYSIRAYLVNTGSTTLGFSFLGTLSTTDGSATISNNTEGCCENNVISILNILETDCNEAFDPGEQLGGGWTINLKDSGNNIIRTEITDINGNIFFTGLTDGTYIVEIVNQIGWASSNPMTVSVANNEVKIIELFNCPN